MQSKIKIKVSTPWNHTDYFTRIPASFNEKYEFIFEGDGQEVDYWIVWGGIKQYEETAFCSPDNLIYLSDEVFEGRHFYQDFIMQFNCIFTCRKDLRHPKIIHTHELNTWIVNRSFDELQIQNNIPKNKSISVVSSDQVWLKGHKSRFAFVNQLIGHFKDRLDVFGRGFHEVSDKATALAPYKYSIAIENSSIPDYFTEKIADCSLTHTMPIYWGCPNVENYFDADTFLKIDISDLKTSIRLIEQLLDEDPYEKVKERIVEQKNRYLNEYHIFNKLVQLIGKHCPLDNKKKMIHVKAEHRFVRGNKMNFYFSKLQGLFGRSESKKIKLSFNQTDLYSNP